MKNAVVYSLLSASAAIVSAQVTFDNGKYTCAKPNAAYCAGDSLKTDIIIRCDADGNGQPGRCSDNLAGEPPVGNTPALCWQTDDTSGDAACEKNCVVYGGSGNANGTFTLPTEDCTPTFTASSTAGPTETETGTGQPTETTGAATSYSTAVPPPESTGSYPAESTELPGTTTAGGGGAGSTGYPTSAGNGTVTRVTTVSGTATGSPIPPSTTSQPSSVPTAGAVANSVTGALGLVGLAIAYLL